MKLEELEKQYKKLGEEIERLKNGEKEWVPEYNERYYYYDKDIETVLEASWSNSNGDNTRLKNKVIFKTKAEAQRYADYQKAKEEYSYEFSREEWENNNTNKYCIRYDFSHKNLCTETYWHWKKIETIYFKSEEQAQKFIDKYKAEILEFEFGVKE